MPERLRELGGVERPGAPERHEREVTRVEAAVDGHHPDRARHVVVADARRCRAPRPRARAPALREARRPPVAQRPRRARTPPARSAVPAEPPQHDVRVGDRGLRRRRGRRPRARARAPALWGPTCGRSPASTHAIEPPPAPIVMRSMAGNRMGCPNWGEYSVTTRALPSRTTAMSADVPPMSRLMTWSRPSSRASSWATTTVAAGLPDAGRAPPARALGGLRARRRPGGHEACREARRGCPRSSGRRPSASPSSRPAKPASRSRRSRAER